jgi:hypothetical protein
MHTNEPAVLGVYHCRGSIAALQHIRAPCSSETVPVDCAANARSTCLSKNRCAPPAASHRAATSASLTTRCSDCCSVPSRSPPTCTPLHRALLHMLLPRCLATAPHHRAVKFEARKPGCGHQPSDNMILADAYPHAHIRQEACHGLNKRFPRHLRRARRTRAARSSRITTPMPVLALTLALAPTSALVPVSAVAAWLATLVIAVALCVVLALRLPGWHNPLHHLTGLVNRCRVEERHAVT